MCQYWYQTNKSSLIALYYNKYEPNIRYVKDVDSAVISVLLLNVGAVDNVREIRSIYLTIDLFIGVRSSPHRTRQ